MRTDIPMDLSRNVMLDIETAGTRPGCIILAIAACTFDQQNTFKHLINFDISKSFGFEEDRSTMEWWYKQNAQLREYMFSGHEHPLLALNAFYDWYSLIDAKDRVYIWCKGANFDFPILEAYYHAFDLAVPWHYRNVRDHRTLASLMPHVEYVRPAISHDPLEDAKAQAAHAVKILQVL